MSEKPSAQGSRTVNEKLSALRELMKERGLDAYLVPSGDAHGSEYVAPYWGAREWISGFTGSAGLLVVLPEEAGLWTDGRYFIQAAQELADSSIDLYKSGEPKVPKYTEFLAEKLPDGGKLGFDGRVVSASEFKRIKGALKGKKIEFFYKDDLVGEIWHDRPPMPQEKTFPHPIEFAGKTSEQKLADVREKMAEKKITAYLLCALDAVAWLTNLRGNDVKFVPVAYAYALVTADTAYLFIEREKIPAEIAPDGFQIRAYDEVGDFLQNHERLYYNPAFTNVFLAESVKSDAHKLLTPAQDIVSLLKAVKSEAELAGIKNAFLRESVALVKALSWLDDAIRGETPITEGDVVRVLQNFRKGTENYLSDSFSTICAYGANAAQAHYSSGETGATLCAEGFLLIDTGGQYLDGTTDTTRTVCLGGISDEMRRDFTLVLKGHLSVSRAVFLKGTTGTQLDILARQPLWESGQNYSHGTGHGLGNCLSVHEGPHALAQTSVSVGFSAGMLVTNEPGIYKEGRYGIRTENALAVAEREKTPDGTFLQFENLIFCPFDIRVVDVNMLTDAERKQLNDYHARTFELVSPRIDEKERAWLEKMTRPL